MNWMNWKHAAQTELVFALKEKKSIVDLCNRYFSGFDTQAGQYAAAGIIETLLSIVACGRAIGLPISVPELDDDFTQAALGFNRAFEFRQFDEQFRKKTWNLIYFVDEMNKRGMLGFKEQAKKSNDAAAIPVRIVEMPTRVKTSEIERDVDGRIISSTQIEMDAA